MHWGGVNAGPKVSGLDATSLPLECRPYTVSESEQERPMM